MHIHKPCLVLVPDTFISLSDATLAAGGKRPNTTSLLVQCILEEFEYIPVEPVLRKYWSDSAGTKTCFVCTDAIVLLLEQDSSSSISSVLKTMNVRLLSLQSQTSGCMRSYLALLYTHYCPCRYYALSAASALFKHAEVKMNIRFSAVSLRIRYVQTEGTMMIDPETARNLELVGNMTSKRSSHSLFGFVNV